MFSRFRDVVVLVDTGAMKSFGTKFKAKVVQILVYLSTPILSEPSHPLAELDDSYHSATLLLCVIAHIVN